jgi:hypothetical protein
LLLEKAHEGIVPEALGVAAMGIVVINVKASDPDDSLQLQ